MRFEDFLDSYATHYQRAAHHYQPLPVAKGLQTSHQLEDALTVGFFGMHSEALAIILGGHGATHEGRRIVPVLPSKSPQYLRTNDDAVQTSAFHYLHNNTLHPVNAPLVLDGVHFFYAIPVGYDLAFAPRYRPPDATLLDGYDLDALTENKLAAKRAIEGTVKKPAHTLNIHDTPFDDFAVKVAHGNQGDHIRLFGRQDAGVGTAYANTLADNGHHVFIEERIYPLPWHKKGKRLDWNIRALVTSEENPHWLDAIVRYRKIDSYPVNLCKGARPAELETALEHTGEDIEEIQETALKSAKALYHAAGSGAPGFLGIDLIASEHGVYFLEANTAPGGFSTLAKLRNTPPASARKLLERFGPFLHQNHERNTDYRNAIGGRAPAQLIPYPDSSLL